MGGSGGGGARERGVIGDRKEMKKRALTRPGALALEMALHEESERRALQGELASAGGLARGRGDRGDR